MFEWWDPLTGAPCKSSAQTLADYVRDGSPYPEVEHDTPGPKEGHCVRPGRYLFSGAGRSFDVDYIQASTQTALNALTGALETIEVTEYDASLDFGSWIDLVINTDITSQHPGDSPVLDIQNAGGTPYMGNFMDDPNPSGTAADWFRFSAARSTSGWTVRSNGRALARLFFDGDDVAQATGYYDYVPEGRPVMRLHRYPNPTTASRQYTVRLVLLRPDEMPEDPGPFVNRTITINRINPDLSPGTIGAPGLATLGNPISITIPERNLGIENFGVVEAGWTGNVYLSTDAALSPETDRLVDTYVETSVIEPNSTLQKQRQPIVPADLAPGTYYVIASLDANGTVLESNEANNVGASGSITVAPPVYACALFEGKTTWRMTDQLFTAKYPCTSQGTNIRYRWQTDAGGSWTEYSASPLYEFAGHAAAGSHTVTFEVKDVSTGVTATDVQTFTVQSGMVTVSGPTDITVKKNYYTYTSNTSSYWWERFLPATNWQGGNGPWTAWTRTWYGGCYEVDVRADASGGGVLKRGRLHVYVRIGSGCAPPPVL